jgi:hypothetical protein
MKVRASVACLAAAVAAVCVLLTGCAQSQGPAKAAPKAPAAASAAGWTVVYAPDFKGSGKLPEEWAAPAGEARIEGGALVLTAPADEEAQLVLLKPRVAGSVRIECVASLKGDPISDISPFINTDTSGQGTGYLFQFGGRGNTLNRLCRYDEGIDETVKDKPLIKPGQKYRLLVENDGGRLRMAIDGQEVFRWTDPQPLKGASHDCVGFYTWGCSLVIEKLAVSAKTGPAAAK